ncbi:hypothetical protein EX895_002899 [Sporisorium graminicola]|uniref:Haem-binding uptake Tiki superfamily ChaN domain-containing protein n=1 Tax=Sporisorium graminicola TaxID=280036 RepID=A0A4V6EU55_9BASI|nr:hypothetical protein EX895_002899 [Sporisorium graminicola]TKY88189.1 hypothetical protein EX895_002899 [Sporisorium graminicola]
MTTAEPGPGSETPLGAMSIARFIPRFTKPQLLTNNIPTYRQSFSYPNRGSQEAASSLPISFDQPQQQARARTDDESEKQQKQDPSNAAYVEWSKLLPVPSNLLCSFKDLFEAQRGTEEAKGRGSKTAPQKATDTLRLPPSASPPPRLVFFGEQHHQPLVMRAQLQTMHALYKQCQLASNPTALQADANPIYRLHLVLEHFSVLDQHMLDSFSHGQLDPDQFADAYRAHSREAFHIGHYMPLLMLAKELHVPIWGGFPPRSWAKQVFRDGVESVKIDEQRRASSASQEIVRSASQGDASSTLPRPPLFTSWNAVTKISAAHRSYLSGLMRPDLPPRFPQLPSTSSSTYVANGLTNDEVKDSLPIYPTWLLKPHNIEAKGFGPAQALKDSYLAHVTAWILSGACQRDPVTSDHGVQSTASQKESPLLNDTAEKDNSSRPIVNIALVVCGLGHCEYGFGAPERVVQLLSKQGESSTANDTSTLLPYIIASKPLDSGIWLGYEHPSRASASNRLDTAQQASEPKQSEALEPASTDLGAVERWLNDPWGRKMADAVLLYDWIDDESHQGADTTADGYQTTCNSST